MGYWEIPEEDQPPTELYGNDERLAEWFEDVKKRREEKYKPGGGERLEEVPLAKNELTLPELELPKGW